MHLYPQDSAPAIDTHDTFDFQHNTRSFATRSSYLLDFRTRNTSRNYKRKPDKKDPGVDTLLRRLGGGDARRLPGVG